MATLVLSTVGTALGGPAGGAIGALIGQSIDQELLGPASRGPRLGDLSVQTSTYGTQIPRIYGTVRVAGSVVWATDLAESAATTGAKGQPDTTFSYSVSLAVALSSRPLQSVRRIWADGKLLRGEEGDFKVSTTFRFYDGGEDQNIDPLIGSTEGIASTPAYRALSLAVFENLELAEFGNRIPFLTFEVVADVDAPTAGEILFDSSSGAIAGVGGRSIGGYACYGASIKAAVKPLIDCCGIDLLDDGLQLKSVPSGVLPISDLDLGYSADSQPSSKIQREQAPARDVPTSLRLSYYDSALDYQAGESRASTGEQGGKEERIELPAVLDASAAKSLVEEAMARAWARRDKLTLRLPPAHLDLQPGVRLEVLLSPSHWTVETCTVESFVVVAELRPCRPTGLALVADSGRIASNPDVVLGELTLALFETPAALCLPNAPSVMLAASSPTTGWKSRGVEVSVGDQRSVVRTALRKSKLGRSLTALPANDDAMVSVDVEIVDASQWLVSCDDDALAEGGNVAILGREIIQFGDAVPIGPGRFRLSRLLRGRDRTGSAMAGHATNEWFVLIESNALRVIELPSWSIGSEASAKAIGAEAGVAEAHATIGWGGLRPLSGSALLLDGVQVVGARGSAIASPTGGTTVDSEARSTIDQLLGALRQHGLIEF